MARATIPTLTLIMLLGLNINIECQVLPRPPISMPLRPLCISQFALVNHACAFLPFNPIPPPSPPEPVPPSPPGPPPPSPPGQGHGNRHRHGRRHGHGHRQRHNKTPIEEDCCWWLKQVDSECVCDMLVMLPPFLSKPMHQYSVIVNNSCNISFQCAGRRF